MRRRARGPSDRSLEQDAGLSGGASPATGAAFSKTAPRKPRPWAVGVTIPAHDEEASVERCLASVLSSIDQARPEESWVVLVADACGDATERLARRSLGGRGQVLRSGARSAGAARRKGSASLLAHFRSRPPSTLWMMNTDADTEVPVGWVEGHLDLADLGWMGIAGILDVVDFPGHGPRAQEVFARTYALRSDGTHDHAHGANLGFRADAYLLAGGFWRRRLSEDRCLWRRVKRRGLPVLATTGSVVRTSGRAVGRARGGFADTLRRDCERLGG